MSVPPQSISVNLSQSFHNPAMSRTLRTDLASQDDPTAGPPLRTVRPRRQHRRFSREFFAFLPPTLAGTIRRSLSARLAAPLSDAESTATLARGKSRRWLRLPSSC